MFPNAASILARLADQVTLPDGCSFALTDDRLTVASDDDASQYLGDLDFAQ